MYLLLTGAISDFGRQMGWQHERLRSISSTVVKNESPLTATRQGHFWCPFIHSTLFMKCLCYVQHHARYLKCWILYNLWLKHTHTNAHTCTHSQNPANGRQSLETSRCSSTASYLQKDTHIVHIWSGQTTWPHVASASVSIKWSCLSL